MLMMSNNGAKDSSVYTVDILFVSKTLNVYVRHVTVRWMYA